MNTAYLIVKENSRGNFHGRTSWEDARDAASDIEQRLSASCGLGWSIDDLTFGKHVVRLLQDEIKKLEPHLQKMIEIEVVSLEDE